MLIYQRVYTVNNGEKNLMVIIWLMMVFLITCLVVEPTPLKNHGVRQLG